MSALPPADTGEAPMEPARATSTASAEKPIADAAVTQLNASTGNDPPVTDLPVSAATQEFPAVQEVDEEAAPSAILKVETDADMKESMVPDEETSIDDVKESPIAEKQPTDIQVDETTGVDSNTAVSAADEPAGTAASADDEEEKASQMTDENESKSDGEQVATEAPVVQKEPIYSTRGRSTDKEASSGDDRSSAVNALEELGRVKESAPATLGVSFLESLTDEERRTRTRFIPEVEGMHSLKKHEVKDDLLLARSLVSSSGVTSLKRSKKRASEEMDVDEEGATSPSEDSSTDGLRPGTKLVEFSTRDLIVPSNAFVGSEKDGHTTSISSLKTQNGVKSPLLVDSITGFDPPRPPESVGAKKKHRMLRWERRPEDVEVDLNNYRKTVQRTRQELQKAEAEYSRLETIDAHLRWNFFNHLNLMNEEYARLNEEIGTTQQECVKAADLFASRTRSRGANKGGYVMKDVLSVLKAKGAESDAAMEAAQFPIIENPLASVGIGGLAPSVFQDWDRRSTIVQREVASSWTVPGDRVKTPYGEGVVVEVFPPMSVSDSLTAESTIKGDNLDSNEKVIEENAKKGKGKGNAEKEKEKENMEEAGDKKNFDAHLMPRVSVKLSFGIGFFPFTAIEQVGNSCLLSDARLAARWSTMVKSAMLVGSTIDLEGMNYNAKTKMSESNSANTDEPDTSMEVDGTIAPQEEKTRVDGESLNMNDVDEEHFMPYGSGLLPTASGRGSLLEKVSLTDIEKAMKHGLYEGEGVLGKKTNQGVTEDFRKWEDEQQEYVTLQASALHLRNALIRQKRMRLNNERTNATIAERYNRSAELVVEMRSDLKTLKHRLEDELKELGMSNEITDQILSEHYLGQDSPVDVGEASPLKRSRRSLGRVAPPKARAVPADEQSGDDQDLSGDDMETRPSKRVRPNQ